MTKRLSSISHFFRIQFIFYIALFLLDLIFIIINSQSDPNLDFNIYFFSFFWNYTEFYRPELRIQIHDNNICNKCNYCYYNINPNSSPKDFLFLFGINRTFNLNLLVRTLRHVRSKCSVVIFLNDIAYNRLSKESFEDLLDCSVNIINIDKIELQSKADVFTIPYIYMTNFIRRNIDQIDRIIKLDMHDSFFQMDPFNEDLPLRGVHITEEGGNMTTAAGVVNNKLINMFEYNNTNLDYQYICAGYFGGNARDILHFLSFSLQFFSFGNDLHDQGLFNYLIVSGIYQNNNITIIKSGSRIRHIAGLHYNLDDYSLGQISVGYNPYITASVVHQYYFIKSVMEDLTKYCPNDKNITDYLTPDKLMFFRNK